MNIPTTEYEYKIGQEIGLKDIIDITDVRWFTLIGIEMDNELPIGWFYLKSDSDSENIYNGPFGPYADMVESISDRLVVR